MRLPYRVRQVVYYTRADKQAPPEIPPEIRQHLNEVMELQFRILSTGDQRHLLAVYRYLDAHGADEDTKVAGLLHDIGKACRKCNITTLDRCVHVFCNRFLPGPYRVLMRRDQAPDWARGVHRLANHAERGAEAARQAGYNERVQWLILHHERGGDPSDPQLQLLRRADDIAGTGGAG